MTGEAPMKETLAASLLKLTGWTPDQPLLDPMCGSGTIAIEAALIAQNIAPGTLRKRFGFQSMKGFNREAWDRVVEEEALDGEKRDNPLQIYAFDQDRDAIQAARRNAGNAGVLEDINIRRIPVDMAEPPAESGFVITNPPYGERLTHEFEDSIKDLGYVLKNKFAGWKVFVLSGYADSGNLMGLKASKKWPIMNGKIECRLLQYDIRKMNPRP